MAKTRRANSEGSIWKRSDGRWVAAVITDNGRRISRYGKTRAEVHAQLQALLREREIGLEVGRSRQTMDDFLA
ncbi:MAG: site-specific integrase, partial [SAR202 cluster bacterium]|nr:site-specific integrase [SAR202 cluster bacterium]